MSEAYRYTCARCGSVSVRHNVGDGWYCGRHGHHTPVVFDRKRKAWVQDPQAQTDTALAD